MVLTNEWLTSYLYNFPECQETRTSQKSTFGNKIVDYSYDPEAKQQVHGIHFSTYIDKIQIPKTNIANTVIINFN